MNAGNSRQPRIYVSAMETEVEGLPRFDPQAEHLLVRLAEVGYVVAWEKEFRDYTIIEQDIAASDALLAIVDTTWTSSTWMAIEVTYAIGEVGLGITSNSRMMPIPILMYPVAPDASLRFPFNCPEHVPLDREVEKALVQVMDVLPFAVDPY